MLPHLLGVKRHNIVGKVAHEFIFLTGHFLPPCLASRGFLRSQSVSVSQITTFGGFPPRKISKVAPRKTSNSKSIPAFSAFFIRLVRLLTKSDVVSGFASRCSPASPSVGSRLVSPIAERPAKKKKKKITSIRIHNPSSIEKSRRYPL